MEKRRREKNKKENGEERKAGKINKILIIIFLHKESKRQKYP